ncbi:MAG: lysophospholipid acyltransferase family protein [Candidatus Thalassarchaeaceae archaeon]|nr:lysophospholipid acyltransferase family protein [Candidatus Thalassarchaeaceae archaeon]
MDSVLNQRVSVNNKSPWNLTMGSNAVDTLTTLSGIKGQSKLPFTPLYPLLLRIGPVILRSIFRIRTRGAERIPKKGAVILAGNHLAHVDPILMIVGSRRTLRFLSKKEHYSQAFTKLVMTTTGQIETDRESGGKDALINAKQVLSNGGAMGIFPEGTRSRRTEPPFMLKGKTGVARLAATFPDVPLHPIALLDTHKMLKPGSSMFRISTPITMSVGEGITWRTWIHHPEGGGYSEEGLQSIADAEDSEREKEMAMLYRRFTDQLMGTLSALGAP